MHKQCKKTYQVDHLISWQAVWHPQTKHWQQSTNRWCDAGRKGNVWHLHHICHESHHHYTIDRKAQRSVYSVSLEFLFSVSFCFLNIHYSLSLPNDFQFSTWLRSFTQKFNFKFQQCLLAQYQHMKINIGEFKIETSKLKRKYAYNILLSS